MAAFVFLVAAAWALFVPTDFPPGLAGYRPLFFAVIAGTGRRVLGVPIGSNHYSPVFDLARACFK